MNPVDPEYELLAPTLGAADIIMVGPALLEEIWVDASGWNLWDGEALDPKLMVG